MELMMNGYLAEKKTEESKTSTLAIFKDNGEYGLLKMRFPFLEHLCEDLTKFRNIFFRDGDTFEVFNVVLNRACRKQSKREASRMKETVEAIKPGLRRIKGKSGHKCSRAVCCTSKPTPNPGRRFISSPNGWILQKL